MKQRAASFLRLLTLAGALAAAAAPRVPVAWADDAGAVKARALYERGEKLFALGRFEEALTQYQQAFDAEPLPGFLFNIGQCYRNLGDTRAAIFSYKKYLSLDPQAPNREAVETLIAQLEDKLAHEQAPPVGPVVPKPAGKKPVYKRWWFWTGIGAVAVGGGVATYLLVTRDHAPDTDLGTIDFGH